jgi:hypothetical protein
MVEKISNLRFQTTNPQPTGGASGRRPTDGATGEGVRAPGTERGAGAPGAPGEPFPLPLPGCVVWFMPDGGLRLTALSRNGGGSRAAGLPRDALHEAHHPEALLPGVAEVDPAALPARPSAGSAPTLEGIGIMEQRGRGSSCGVWPPSAGSSESGSRGFESRATLGKWRCRFLTGRCDGLLDEPRPGAPREIGDEQIERVIAMTLKSVPKDATHWSTRSMTNASGMTQSTLSRV